MSGTDPTIAIEDVTVELGGSTVLEDVTTGVGTGRLVGLVGPNGAGKTTLLHTINGRLAPAAGRIRIEGSPVDELSARELGRRVATVPQKTALAFDFDVRSVVEMGRYPHRSRFGMGDPEPDRIDDALARTDTAALADRSVQAISGGERQRVLIARALAQATPVLLLDEPTASLDINHQVRTLELVRELVDDDGKTVLAAIHDLDLAARFCDELRLLYDGRIRASGDPDAVLGSDHLQRAFGTPTTIHRNPTTGTASVTAMPGEGHDPEAAGETDRRVETADADD